MIGVAGADRRLIDVLADLVVKSAPYGEQDGGFVFVYLVPTGPVHRAITLLHEYGVIVRPGFDGRVSQPIGDLMILPSVGRVVHYRSRGSADGRYEPECRAAIVTAVGDYPEGISDADRPNIAVPVSLCVLNPYGMFFDQDVMQSEIGREGGTWHWPERV